MKVRLRSRELISSTHALHALLKAWLNTRSMKRRKRLFSAATATHLRAGTQEETNALGGYSRGEHRLALKKALIGEIAGVCGVLVNRIAAHWFSALTRPWLCSRRATFCCLFFSAIMSAQVPNAAAAMQREHTHTRPLRASTRASRDHTAACSLTQHARRLHARH
eukprot:4772713-Prymnesium_polylepis.2